MKLFQPYTVWAALTLPAIAILYLYVTDIWSYGQALAMSGDISVWLLMLVLAVRPLLRFMPNLRAGRVLMSYRRALGVAVFAYAMLHLIIYLVYRADAARILSEGIEPDLLTGWIALIIFAPLAITSRNASVRKLGKRWGKLHKWIYPAAVLVTVHWVLTAFDPTSAYIHGAIILGLLLLRIVRKRSDGTQ